MKSAIVLCSGGIDSVTTAFYVKKILKYKKILILFFDYGQRSLTAERIYSLKCARNLRANFYEMKLKYLDDISTSLINRKKKHKRLSRKNLKDTKKEGEKWYVPCRNLIFLSNALALAEALKIKSGVKYNIFVGFKSEGKEPYPDTTKKFVEIVAQISKHSTEGKFKIFSPLIEKDKEDVVLLAKKLGINFKESFSCYTSNKKHCGTCLACRLRQEGFYWANVTDTTKYAN